MAATDLLHADEMGPAGGIDRSRNPRPGSVWDACNLSTADGTWKTRPGFKESLTIWSPVNPAIAVGFDEYDPDHRYDSSYYYAVVAVFRYNNGHFFWEFHNSEEAPTNITPDPIPTSGTWNWWSSAHTLHRYLLDNGRAKYTPCIVFTNGVDPPYVYHQKDREGKMERLQAIDGGDSDISYLSEPPRGKYVVKHLERLWMLNIKNEAGNRWYHSGTISGTTNWPAEVWPAAYNGDVGGGDKELTGGASFRGNLVLFKEDEMWVVSGDGVGGMWQIDQIDAQAGAINQDCVVDVGDSLVFFNRTGAYRWAGGAAKRISHPALDGVWDDYNWIVGEKKHLHAAYDEKHRRVLIVTGRNTESLLSALVYNLDTGTWDRWGEWPGNPSSASIRPYSVTYFPETFFSIRRWSADGVSVCGIIDGKMMIMGDRFESNSGHPIHWYLRTHRYFETTDESKLLRRVMVYAKLTGNWEMSVLPMVDHQSLTEALRHGVKNYNTIVDSANAAEHIVTSTSNFQEASDGPVDVYFTPVMHKLFDSRAIVAATATNKIKFSALLDSTDMAGTLLVLPEDSARIKFIGMSPEFYLGGANSKVGDALAQGDEYNKITVSGVNRIGKSFSLWLSNVGSYESGGKYCKPIRCDIKGWGLWVRRRGVWR
ncbi:MAG: hypothetical protein R6U98_06585 [Pirellulaceae bacterium]